MRKVEGRKLLKHNLSETETETERATLCSLYHRKFESLSLTHSAFSPLWLRLGMFLSLVNLFLHFKWVLLLSWKNSFFFEFLFFLFNVMIVLACSLLFSFNSGYNYLFNIQQWQSSFLILNLILDCFCLVLLCIQ